MADSEEQRWRDAFEHWATDRLDWIVSERGDEYRGVMEWLGLGVLVEFVPLGTVIDDETDPAGDGVGVRVGKYGDQPDDAATLTLLPVRTSSNTHPIYALNAVGSCRRCRRRTRLEPTLRLSAGEVREPEGRDVRVLLGQAVSRQRPVDSHDCAAPPASVAGDELPGAGPYL